MYRRDILERLSTPLVLCAIGCGVLACILIVSVWMVKTQDTGEKMSLAMMSSSTIPYVTDTTAFTAYLHDVLEESGAASVQSHIRELYADAPYGEQHMSFHYLGEVLYEVAGAEALPLCESWYGFGCYHGFLLSAIGTEGYEIVPSLDEACVERYGDSMETETCQHGIGHGLLEFSGRDPLEAVAACDLVADVYPKLGCASGVFMEYFAPTQSDARSRVTLAPVFDENDPLNVCDELVGMRLATCLFEIHAWWADAVHLSPRTIEALCNSVQDQEAREFCLIGYGNFNGPFVEPALPFCNAFVSLESRALCRAGVLWAAEHHNDAPNPENACSDLPDEHRATCFEKGRFTCEVEGDCRL